MIDAHVHIERGPYTIEWIEQFVKYALLNDINELFLLEHSHRFIEFTPLYDGVKNYNEYQKNWLSSKLNISLQSYFDLIDVCKKQKYPIIIKWGLEVCFINDKEEFINKMLRGMSSLDFFTGSVHYINDWGFDHKKEFWNDKDVDKMYNDYYKIMIGLVKSKLFTYLAHPDSIKCFNNYPQKNMDELYIKLSKELVKNNMKAEYSAGLVNNYGHNELGINKKLLKIMKENGVELITASDAHKPEDVGKNIKICYERLRGYCN
jgi:histidinol-phosphatase (PHP family)